MDILIDMAVGFAALLVIVGFAALLVIFVLVSVTIKFPVVQYILGGLGVLAVSALLGWVIRSS